MNVVRAAVLKETFMDLPSDIAPERVLPHRPDLRLSITLGGKSHQVRLYAPDEMGRTPKALRFLAGWKAVFENVPIRPSW